MAMDMCFSCEDHAMRIVANRLEGILSLFDKCKREERGLDRRSWFCYQWRLEMQLNPSHVGDRGWLVHSWTCFSSVQFVTSILPPTHI